MPGVELVDPVFQKLFGMLLGANSAQGLDSRFPPFEVRLDAVSEVAACKSAETDLGGEVVLAGAINRDKVNSAEGTQHAKSLANGAFAQLQTRDQIVKGQRLLAAIEKAVDFPQRARQGENGKGPDKEVYGFHLEGSQAQGRRGGQGKV